MYELSGLYVVTKGMWLVVCLPLARKLVSCVSDRTLHISDSTLSLLYPHETEKIGIFQYSLL